MLRADEHVNALIDEIIVAIADGSQNIVLWGIESSGLSVLSTLYSFGLMSFISGLIDDRSAICGQTFYGLKVQHPEDLGGIKLDTLVVTADKEKEAILEHFSRTDARIPRIILSGHANYEFDDEVFVDILKSCSVKSRAGGYSHMLVHLFQSLKYIATRNLQGSVVEFGVFQGGTTVFMAKVLQYYGYTGRIFGFDTFSGFPERKHALDIYREKKDEFPDYETVKHYCSPYNIELIQGDICQTYTQLHDISLALSFFDTDNYTPTRKALELCIEQTVPGGILAFDHYFSPGWNKTVGERIAIRQALENKEVFNLYGTGIFIKV